MSGLTNAIDALEGGVKPGKTYLSGGRRVDYGTLFRHARALAGLFARHGLEPGDRVLLVSQDDASLLPLFLALLRSGLTAVILDPLAPESELRALATAADARGCFADREVLERAALAELLRPGALVVPVSAEPGVRKGVLGGLFSRAPGGDPGSYPAIAEAQAAAEALPGDLSDSTIAYILFTSGTTSRPKGVEISHRALWAQMQTFIRHYGFSAELRLLNLLPLHHTDGLTQGGLVTFLVGGTLFRPFRFSVDLLPKVLDTLYRERITHFVIVPSVLTLIDKLGEDYLDSFQGQEFAFVISTAAYLDPKLWERFEERYRVKVVNVYGLTETVCESLYCGPDEATRKRGTVGKPVDSKARIVDEKGRDLPPGTVGELLLHGPHIMSGYFRNPEATAEVLSSDGWFRTGDLALEDEEGFFAIVGRKKDVIITGGVNVYPEDVTGVLRSLPEVLDAVTFGEPDEIWGERVVSCIVPRPGTHPSEQSLTAAFLAQASRSKLPKEIHILEEFPRGPAGKVVVAELRRRLASRPRRATKSGLELGDSVASRVLGLASQEFRVAAAELRRESNPENTKGWTSLAHVEFLLALEVEFGVKFGPSDIMRITSLGAAISAIETKLG